MLFSSKYAGNSVFAILFLLCGHALSDGKMPDMLSKATLPAGAPLDDLFPAGVSVSGDAEAVTRVAKKYAAIFGNNGTSVDLYMTEKAFRGLMTEFSASIDAGRLNVAIVQTHRQALLNMATKGKGPYARYHSFAEMVLEMESLDSANSDIFKLESIGTASDGNEIWAVKISDSVDKDEDEPATLISGGIHGNETPGTETVIAIINEIVSNRLNYSDLIDNLQMWFIPIVNPYGHEQLVRENANGVDLNRDFPKPSDTGQKQNEPETQALVDFFGKTKHIVASIDFHTMGGMYMYPWASISADAEELGVFDALCREMAALPNYACGSIIDITHQTIDNSAVDYYYGKFGTIAFGVELGTGSVTPPSDELDTVIPPNLEAAVILLGRVLESTFTGIATKECEPVAATVSVFGIDDNLLHRYPIESDSDFGRYYRIVQPGRYDIAFSFYGKDIIKKNVEAARGAQTLLNVNFGAGCDGKLDTDSSEETDTDSNAISDDDGNDDRGTGADGGEDSGMPGAGGASCGCSVAGKETPSLLNLLNRLFLASRIEAVRTQD